MKVSYRWGIKSNENNNKMNFQHVPEADFLKKNLYSIFKIWSQHKFTHPGFCQNSSISLVEKCCNRGFLTGFAIQVLRWTVTLSNPP